MSDFDTSIGQVGEYLRNRLQQRIVQCARRDVDGKEKVSER